MGFLTEIQDDSLFSLDRVGSVRPRFEHRQIPGIEINMNLDQKKIERHTFTITDALAVIGGFFGLCTSVFSTLVVILATTDVQSDLRESLFRETKKKDDSNQSRC